MKKFISVISAAVLSVGLAACSGESETQPTATVTVTESATPTPEVTPESEYEFTDAQFAQMVRDNTSAFDGASDEDIVNAGKSVCGIWENGGTIDDVLEAVLNSGVDARDGGFLAGAGTQAYCPEYADQISSAVGSNA